MRALWAIVWAACVGVGTSGASAQSDLPADFLAWWERITAGGANGPNWDGVSLKYRVEFVYLPPAEELAALRSRVAGRPEHPERSKLAEYEKYIASGKPPATARQIWRYGDEWRCSKTWDRPDLPYWDFGWSREGAWQLMPNLLVVVPADAATTEGAQIASESSGMTLEASMFVSAGLINAPALRVPLSVRFTSPGRWEAHGTHGDDREHVRFRAEGLWGMGSGGTVERCVLEVRRPPTSGPTIETYVAEGWENLTAVGMSLAGVVTQYNTAGAAEKRYVLLGAERFTQEEFHRLVRVPRLDQPDPVRGMPTFRRVRDTRPGADRLWEGQGLPPTIAQSAQGSQESRWRLGGWLLAGLLLATVVLVRIARIRAGAKIGDIKERRST